MVFFRSSDYLHESIRSSGAKKSRKKYQLATVKKKEEVNANSKRLGGSESFLPSCLKIAFAMLW